MIGLVDSGNPAEMSVRLHLNAGLADSLMGAETSFTAAHDSCLMPRQLCHFLYQLGAQL